MRVPPASVLITGASSGVGAALAEHYAAAGVTLHLAGRNAERLEAVAARCRVRGAAVHTHSVDVTDARAMEAWVLAADAHTPLDLVIANAGISGGSGSIHGEAPAQLSHILAVNVGGVLNTLQPLIPRMSARGRGQMAVMGSLAGFRGMPSAPAYSMSKAAVHAYGDALRGWLGKAGVRVSVITPGYIRTPLTDKNPFPMPFLMEPERAARIIARGLLKGKGRIAFPWPLAAAMWAATHLLPVALSDAIFSRLPAKPPVGNAP